MPTIQKRLRGLVLSDSEKEGYYNRTKELQKKQKKRIRKDLLKNYDVHTTEMTVTNCATFPFIDGSSGVRFIRTDPLAIYDIPNFDAMLYSFEKKILILIECKQNLSSKITSKIKEFSDKIKFYNENQAVKVGDGEIRPLDELKKILGNKEIKGIDYVLASTNVKVDSLYKTLKELESEKEQKTNTDFIFWDIRIQSSKKYSINILNRFSMLGKDKLKKIDEKVKRKCFHSDPSLPQYFKDIPLSANYISFCYSNDAIYQIIQISEGLKLRSTFNFNIFKDMFKVELNNYSDLEKKTMFKRYTEFSLKVGIIKDTTEDIEDPFEKKYRIVNRDSKNFIGQIIDKITNNKVYYSKEEKIKIKHVVIDEIEVMRGKYEKQQKIDEF